jgi:hypothetical protein
MEGTMSDKRKHAAQVLGVIRLVNGGAALLTPRLMARVLGVNPDEHPQMIYFMRMFGIRTVLLGVQLLATEGEDLDRAMQVGIIIHASDTLAAGAAAATHGLPKRTALNGMLISGLNTVLALYGSGILSSGPNRV